MSAEVQLRVELTYFYQPRVCACDLKCEKAFGVNGRPRIDFDPADPDDNAMLSDDELGEALRNPGTYEGGHGKPMHPTEMNKWCIRECERSVMVDRGADIVLPDFSRRLYNQPWKHKEAKNVDA